MNMEIRDLHFAYADQDVLNGVSFQTQKGELLFLLGSNGAGKSTLFGCLLGLLPKYRGEILLNGTNIRKLTPRQMASELAYIPQLNKPVFPYSVEEMVLMGTTNQLGPFRNPGEKQRKLARQAMETVGVAHLAQQDFSRISGGEQQLTLVARALTQNAAVLIMDEPTSALDYGNQFRILSVIRELTQHRGYTVLMSSHNPQHALLYGDRVLALQEGRIEADGAPGEVLTPALIRRLYRIETERIETAAGTMILPVRD